MEKYEISIVAISEAKWNRAGYKETADKERRVVVMLKNAKIMLKK